MNKTDENKHKSRFFRWFWIVLIAVGCLAAGGIFLCSYTPRAYQPQPATHPEQVSPYLTHTLGPDFFNQVQLDAPFDLRVEQDGLNDILNSWPWPEQFGDLAFSDPVVLFDADKVYLMGKLDYNGVSSILTIIALPQMDSQGRIWLNIQSIRLGVLPVTALVSGLAKKAFQDCRADFECEPELEEVVRAVVHNEPFTPVFKISDRMVQITQFTLEPKRLTLRIEPRQ